jgi:hypothetical protein
VGRTLKRRKWRRESHPGRPSKRNARRMSRRARRPAPLRWARHALHGDEGGKGAGRDERAKFANPGERGLPGGVAADGVTRIFDPPGDQRLVHHRDADTLMGSGVDEPVPVLMHRQGFAERDGEEQVAGSQQGGCLQEAAGIEKAGAAEEVVGYGLGRFVEAARQHAAG